MGIDSGCVSYSGGSVAALVSDVDKTTSTQILRCYNKADVIADNTRDWTYVGGIVGVARAVCVVRDCFNAGNIAMKKAVDTPRTEPVSYTHLDVYKRQR